MPQLEPDARRRHVRRRILVERWETRCIVCDAVFLAKRRDALTCRGPCRAELSRLLRAGHWPPHAIPKGETSET